jgi:hypothetical protein
MHVEGDDLVCWMGRGCGFQPLPEHHEQKMKFVE